MYYPYNKYVENVHELGGVGKRREKPKTPII
jgi:hypothetical protein